VTETNEAPSPELLRAMAAVTDCGKKNDAGKLPWDLLPWDAAVAALEQARELEREHNADDVEIFADVMRNVAAWFERRGDTTELAQGLGYLLAFTPGGPVGMLHDVVAVLQFGANKYAPRNWEKGLAFSRVFAAAARHTAAAEMGEDNDPETGLPHLAHAACELLFALAFVLRGRDDLDDRPLQKPLSDHGTP
jgi:hypothetical protein